MKRGTPKLVPHRKVAEWLSIDPETLRRWVARGEFPEPHSTIAQTWFYPLAQIEHYLQHGRWPEGTRFKRAARVQVRTPASS